MRIDKNIPIPDGGSRPGRKIKYPFRDMAVGDSIFVAGRTPSSLSGSLTLSRNAIDRLSITSGTITRSAFLQRQVNEDGVLGTRVWRIA